jgi:hypothetical protein
MMEDHRIGHGNGKRAGQHGRAGACALPEPGIAHVPDVALAVLEIDGSRQLHEIQRD